MYHAATPLSGLRPYQKELLGVVQAALQSTDEPVMMQLPAGGGKTVIAAHLLRDYLTRGRKAVWITHRRELKGQTLKTLKDMSGLKASAPYWPTNQVAPQQRNGVVILMAQTAGRRSDESYIPDDWISYIWSRYDENDLMIVDEAHPVASSASGWARAWAPEGAGITGKLILCPNTVVLVSMELTSSITLGRKTIESKMRRVR